MTSMVKKIFSKVEFGDFQTPYSLACDICKFLDFLGIQPLSILEPTCGVGNFLQGALQTFSTCKEFVGFDINNEYLEEFKQRTLSLPNSPVKLRNSNFFQVNWQDVLEKIPKPVLILGNPPWVTNSELGNLNGGNLPTKSNFQGYKGIDALTGKSNFDISEWMITRLLYLLQEYDGYLAMLCKTSVARKVLKQAWRNNYRLAKAAIYIIDAKKHFNVSVGACLLLCWTGNSPSAPKCNVYEGLSNNNKIASIGMCGSELLADVEMYHKWSRLDGREHYKWRSGVKHDCAKVMEFYREGNILRNGLGETCCLEDKYLYPIYKSSDIAGNNNVCPRLWVLITQKNVKDDTENIKELAQKTWDYLVAHAEMLDNRKSAIYRKRPRFSIFGIGEYSFSPWKVAISGLYKNTNFAVISPHEGRPTMLDDTCYFISCNNNEEAKLLSGLLNSEAAKKFIRSLVFFDSKRPVTLDILRRLDLMALAEELGKKELLQRFVACPKKCQAETLQKNLF